MREEEGDCPERDEDHGADDDEACVAELVDAQDALVEAEEGHFDAT
jgi:hypothetical protein